MNGLGKKLVPIRNVTTAKRILEVISRDFEKVKKEAKEESELRGLVEP